MDGWGGGVNVFDPTPYVRCIADLLAIAKMQSESIDDMASRVERLEREVREMQAARPARPIVGSYLGHSR